MKTPKTAKVITGVFAGLVAGSWLFISSCAQKNDTSSDAGGRASMPGAKAPASFQGSIVFQSNMDGDNEIYLLSTAGLRKLTDNDWQDEYPLWSPDGKWISFSANPRGNYDIFIMDAAGSGIRRITTSSRDEIEQAWFPDGRKMAYTEEVRRPLGRRYSLWSADLGSGEVRRIAPDFGGSAALPNFSPAGPLMAFTGKRTMGWDIYVYDLEKENYVHLTEGGHACRPHFSPDGRKIAYVSHEADGKGDIWLMNPDGSGKERLTARDETYDYFPAWSPDGRNIVFASSRDTMYADRGEWALYVVEIESRRVELLFDSAGRDVFPDWR
ncbi:MAG: hypothetical protein PHX45_00285 [Acidobacteriota bacterium]|nr:hypothetical protein [Acidobacteriota bacterium]